jgi:hypothetical protein
MMDPRERGREHQQPGGGGGGPPGDGHLHELRAAGEHLLSAGDEAIRRALSGDSEAFLRANRQRGGQ